MTLSKVVGDLQRSGIKRSRLESPGPMILGEQLGSPGMLYFPTLNEELKNTRILNITG